MDIKVVVVDDHKLLRHGLSESLNAIAGIKVVGEATNGHDAIAVAQQCHPDVILMDLMMPEMGGIEATERLLRFMPSTKVVIVSAHSEMPMPGMLLKIGASAYVSKESGIEEMVDAIKHAMNGKQYISSDIAQQMALGRLKPKDETSPFEKLSQKEFQVCMMVVEGQKVTDISEKMFLSAKTVNTYRYRIFEKLNITGDVELTRLAIKWGLINQDVI